MGSRIQSYRELEIWKLAMAIAVSVYELTPALPECERFGISAQLRRSAVSVPSNIAEGWGRGIGQAQISFLRIARGSICELETQLLLCKELRYGQELDLDSLLSRLDRLSRQLTHYSSGIQSKIVREELAPYLASDYAQTDREATNIP